MFSNMKIAFCSLALGICCSLPARADLTITYSTTMQPASKPDESSPAPQAATNMTIKLKGDKMRIDASPKVTTIFDGKTGEVINLMHDQKMVVRIPREKMKAVADMLEKFKGQNTGPEKPVLKPTGQKEIVNGYETEVYTYDGPSFKATYWVAPNYPNGAAILAQLQSVKSEFWDAANTKMPDFRDFQGLPIRIRILLTKEDQQAKPSAAPATKRPRQSETPSHATEITSTITSVNQNPISDSEFAVPGDYKEPKLPNLFGAPSGAPSVSPSP
jgi:Domain of unknown function (DUF4412)